LRGDSGVGTGEGGKHQRVSTGPIPAGVTTELEALKTQLISMRPDELPEAQAAAIAAEISAIRLQLKRLEADRELLAGTDDA
jgi:hypothetical protein